MRLDADRIDEALSDVVGTGAVPGVVGIVADADTVLYHRAFGRRTADDDEPLAIDAPFRIASMTKLPTTVAALQLVDSDRLQLDAPVGDYLPAFDRLDVLTGFSEEGRPVLRRPRSRATVRQLCAHVSGLSYDTWDEALSRYHQVTGLPLISAGLRATFQAPLVDDPGIAFHYGTSSDWLGLLIETVAGRPLQAQLASAVFGPLALADTTMVMSDEQRRRAAPVHVRGEDGAWIPSALELPADPEFHAGGHALSSTPGDFARLQRALLRGGELDGTRILSPQLSAELFVPQTSLTVTPLRSAIPAASADTEFGAGERWGLAFPVTERPHPGKRPVGAGGWAGLWNTYFWLDPANGMVAGFYTQTSPFCAPSVIDAFERFERAVYGGALG